MGDDALETLNGRRQDSWVEDRVEMKSSRWQLYRARRALNGTIYTEPIRRAAVAQPRGSGLLGLCLGVVAAVALRYAASVGQFLPVLMGYLGLAMIVSWLCHTTVAFGRAKVYLIRRGRVYVYGYDEVRLERTNRVLFGRLQYETNRRNFRRFQAFLKAPALPVVAEDRGNLPPILFSTDAR